MRRLAAELGCPPMSLYGHIADRDDVLDGVWELILAKVPVPPSRLPWQEWIRQGYLGYREVLLEHPNAVGAVALRRPGRSSGGSFAATTEAVLQTLTAAGLGIGDAVHAYRLLSTFCFGAVLNEIQNTGRPELLAQAASMEVSAEEFPLLTTARPLFLAPDFGASYDFGLELIIEAIGRTVD